MADRIKAPHRKAGIFQNKKRKMAGSIRGNPPHGWDLSKQKKKDGRFDSGPKRKTAFMLIFFRIVTGGHNHVSSLMLRLAFCLHSHTIQC